jgi:uncharacterized protein YbaP (TraB family)
MRVLVLLAALLIATPAAAKPPVWVVSDGDSQMVLFGSVHVLPPSLDWRPPALDAAIGAADDIWFESPVGETAEREASFLALRLGALRPGQKLSDRLPRGDARRLREMAARYGIPMQRLDAFKPWMAEALVMQAALGRERGAYLAYGVETTVDRSAPPTARREAFATNAEHLAILGGGAEAEQIASLRRTLRDLEAGPKAYTQATDAWMRGDLKWLQRNVVDEMRKGSPAQFRRLATDRNASWAKALDRRLKGQGRTVVIVGMAHLIGPGSLPERLRALGYSVKGP